MKVDLFVALVFSVAIAQSCQAQDGATPGYCDANLRFNKAYNTATLASLDQLINESTTTQRCLDAMADLRKDMAERRSLCPDERRDTFVLQRFDLYANQLTSCFGTCDFSPGPRKEISQTCLGVASWIRDASRFSVIGNGLEE